MRVARGVPCRLVAMILLCGWWVVIATARPAAAAPVTVGDGWEAFFFGDNVYNVPHHRKPPGLFPGTPFLEGIVCYHKLTGAACPGFLPTGNYISSQAGADFGTGPDDLI